MKVYQAQVQEALAMKMPLTPPELSELLQTPGTNRTKLFTLMQTCSSESNDRYVHWDKLVHLPPPEGLTHEEWWLGLKMARAASNRELPLLTDKNGNCFNYNLADPISELLHEIDLRAGGRIAMPPQVINPETKDQYYIESLIEEAITSSQLEGATTTRRVAENLIRSGRQPRDRSETMIFNNYLTMKRIADLKEEALSPDVVCQIHERVTRDTLDDPSAAGRLRKPAEDVFVGDQDGQVFHRPPDADALQRRMDLMCQFANGAPEQTFIHPVLRSIVLHFWLAYDHPFVDGNGRCARALFYWSMLHHGYWLCEYMSISQILLKAPAKYSRSFLYTVTDGNDLTYFLLYHLDVMRRSIDELGKFIRKRTKQLKALESQVKNLDVLNHRQRALLSHAARHPGRQYTINTHKTSHNVVYQTARTDLLDLQSRGLLDARKRGKKWTFTAPEDLQARLAGDID